MVGVEPTLPSGNTILSRGRLPVPPHRHVNYLVLSDHLHTRGNWRDAVEGYSLIIFAETQIYQGLQLIRKTFTHWILSPARLPVSPLRRILSAILQGCLNLKDRCAKLIKSITSSFGQVNNKINHPEIRLTTAQEPLYGPRNSTRVPAP